MALDTTMSCIASLVIFLVSIAAMNFVKPYIVDVPAFYITIGLYGGILCTILLTVCVLMTWFIPSRL